MAAVIEFPDGARATFSEGRWSSDVPKLARVLDLESDGIPAGHFPEPDADLARTVAARLGARLVSADPAPEDLPADAVA